VNSIRQVVPNFFVVGAPKAGTTSLYHYLDQHPEIYMSPVKEPNFLASEIRPENLADELKAEAAQDHAELQDYLRGAMTEKRFGGMITEWEDYLKLFRNVRNEKAIGEASVCYLWSTTAAKNIRRAVGAAKIIMILRDPADRAFSQYLQCLASGRIREPFALHLEQSRRHTGDMFTVMQPLLEFGLYHEQVCRFLTCFGQANVLILFYEDYRRDLAGSLRQIYSFLGIDTNFTADTSKTFHEPQVPRFAATARLLRKLRIHKCIDRVRPGTLRGTMKSALFRSRQSLVMSTTDRTTLIDYYRDDIQKLAALVNRDLSAWLQ
jgi:hypothetical protein